jgi:hypothetical protein
MDAGKPPSSFDHNSVKPNMSPPTISGEFAFGAVYKNVAVGEPPTAWWVLNFLQRTGFKTILLHIGELRIGLKLQRLDLRMRETLLTEHLDGLRDVN